MRLFLVVYYHYSELQLEQRTPMNFRPFPPPVQYLIQPFEQGRTAGKQIAEIRLVDRISWIAEEALLSVAALSFAAGVVRTGLRTKRPKYDRRSLVEFRHVALSVQDVQVSHEMRLCHRGSYRNDGERAHGQRNGIRCG